MGVVMAKNNTSKSNGARKTQARRRSAQKRIRRVIFKADEWYAGAASSIGIAGRSKSARPIQMWMARAEEDAD
jgi:hypothetical protein